MELIVECVCMRLLGSKMVGSGRRNDYEKRAVGLMTLAKLQCGCRCGDAMWVAGRHFQTAVPTYPSMGLDYDVTRQIQEEGVMKLAWRCRAIRSKAISLHQETTALL